MKEVGIFGEDEVELGEIGKVGGRNDEVVGGRFGSNVELERGNGPHAEAAEGGDECVGEVAFSEF